MFRYASSVSSAARNFSQFERARLVVLDAVKEICQLAIYFVLSQKQQRAGEGGFLPQLAFKGAYKQVSLIVGIDIPAGEDHQAIGSMTATMLRIDFGVGRDRVLVDNAFDVVAVDDARPGVICELRVQGEILGEFRHQEAVEGARRASPEGAGGKVDPYLAILVVTDLPQGLRTGS